VPNGKTTYRNKAVQYVKKRDLSMNWEKNGIQREVEKVVVVGEGTSFMKKVNIPTVLIRVSNGDLAKSRVYHVLLEAETESLPRVIVPAIMLSDTSSPWRTQVAELLPLSVVTDRKGNISIKPLLYRTRYRQLFTDGCSFKVLALEIGRFIESSDLPWNQWKLKTPAMRNLITETLYKDIREMPISMIERKTRRAPSKKSISSNSINVFFSDSSSSQDSSKPVLSAHYPNLRVPGITASGGSSFAEWFKVLDPNVHVDKNFKCERGTTLRKDRFVDEEMFYRYLRV